MKQVYICNDTVTGICSALFDAWKEERCGEAGIQLKGRIQQELFCEYKVVIETEQKSRSLQRMIREIWDTTLTGMSITQSCLTIRRKAKLCSA